MIETLGAIIRENFWKSNRPRGGGGVMSRRTCIVDIYIDRHDKKEFISSVADINAHYIYFPFSMSNVCDTEFV